MQYSKRTLLQKVLHLRPGEPTVFTLLTHIIKSAFTGGMFLILIFGSAVIAFFHFNSFSIANLLVLLLGTVVVVAFCRGCSAWQQDLDEYRKHKSGIRNTNEGRT